MMATMSAVHPGEIIFVDGPSGRILDRKKASELPEAVLFVDTDEGPVPVVKIVMFTVEDRREVHEYGPNDVLLQRSTQLLE